MFFFAHDIQSNSSCCGSVSWWHCNHHSLSGEGHASYPAIRCIVGLLFFFYKTGDQHLFSWGAFWGWQNLECPVWRIAQFHKLQILAVTTWIPEPDYWTNYPYRCNVPYVLVLSVDPRLLCLVQEDWVDGALQHKQWWFHLVAAWAETLWTTSRHTCTRFLTRSKKSISIPIWRPFVVCTVWSRSGHWMLP